MDVLRNTYNRGITLVELMILSAILTILMMMVAQNVFGINDESKLIQVQQNLRSIEGAINVYKKDTNRYPTNGYGLRILIDDNDNDPYWNGPYIDEELLKDPWDRPYLYESNYQAYRIYTLGEDGKAGGSNLDEDKSIWNPIR